MEQDVNQVDINILATISWEHLQNKLLSLIFFLQWQVSEGIEGQGLMSYRKRYQFRIPPHFDSGLCFFGEDKQFQDGL